MNVSSIGIQLVQTGTATPQKSPAGDSGGESNDRVPPSAPATSSLPAGVGEQVDKTV